MFLPVLEEKGAGICGKSLEEIVFCLRVLFLIRVDIIELFNWCEFLQPNLCRPPWHWLHVI